MKKLVKLTIIALLFCSFAFCLSASGIIPTSEPTYVYAVSVVKQGSTGATVRTIQTKLKNWGYYKGAVDGISALKPKKP